MAYYFIVSPLFPTIRHFICYAQKLDRALLGAHLGVVTILLDNLHNKIRNIYSWTCYLRDALLHMLLQLNTIPFICFNLGTKDIALLENTPEMERKRQERIHELIMTEERYVNDLLTAVDVSLSKYC